MTTPLRALLLALVACISLPTTLQAAEPARAPIIVFMTDYGTLDDAVAICKGVMLSISPDARVIDLTHQVTAYSIADGARYLARTALYYPANTIFVGVIDPGVGTKRRPIIAKTKRGQYFVVPDNGLLTLIQDRDGIESTREITNPAWMLPGPHSATFHGRDIFAPAAGHLARGDDWSTVGALVAKPVRLAISAASSDTSGVSGHVVSLDGPFGNLITDIKAESFHALGYRLGDTVKIKVGDKPYAVRFVSTFGDVPVGQPLLYIDSSNLLSVAINQGNFAKEHGVTPPVPLHIEKKTADR
jgi:S-adenosylmethionine hydrolase